MALTHLNDAVLNSAQLTVARRNSGWRPPDGARVQSFVVKPYGFQEGRKYPVLMLIHGGPQGFWGHAWTYRWNAQVFAAAGYVVVMPNPRGSTGYGQKFIDEINSDWGGKPFDDIMAVTDYVVARMPYADAEPHGGGRRIVRRLHDRLDPGPHAALQGAGDARWRLRSDQRVRRDRRAVVPAVGDTAARLGTSPRSIRKWSPSSYVKDFHTPTLVVHGELDFRVPYEQGLQLFTALQMQKVPSKLLVFPDEGHWVLKPQNSLLWYQHRDRLDRFLGEKVK